MFGNRWKWFDWAETNPNHVYVEYLKYEISDNPMYSSCYANCNGVVLLNHKFAGVSHFDLTIKPEMYLEELIKKMLKLTTIINNNKRKELSAVIIGGDGDHFKRNKKILERYDIMIEGEYLDNWCEGENFFDDSFKEKAYKDLVVIPSRHEVIIFSPPIGCRRLSNPHRKNLFRFFNSPVAHN